MAEESEPVPVPNQIFVGNLTPETSVEELTNHLTGLQLTPQSCSFFEDPRRRSKGCALVVFDSAEVANSAIEAIAGSTLNEREIFARADRGPRRSKRPKQINEDQSYLFVGNLADSTTAEDLTELFSAHGTVTYANISRKRPTENSLGWGTVQMSTPEEATAAKEALNETDFQERSLSVQTLKSAPRKKGAGKPKESNVAEEPAPTNPCVLYVGNLNWATEAEELEDLFSAHGEVVSAKIAQDKQGSKSRGWGSVELATAEQAAAALEALNKTMFQERQIDVQVLKGPRKREPKQPKEKKARGAKKSEKDNEDGDDAEETGGRRRRRRQKRSDSQQGEEDGEQGGERRRRRRRPRRDGDGEGDEEEKPRRRERNEPEKIVVSNPDCHIYVGNLAWSVTLDDLQELCSKYGTVVNAVVTMNERLNRSRGWGTVEMSSPNEAQACIDGLNETEYMDRSLLLRFDNRVVLE